MPDVRFFPALPLLIALSACQTTYESPATQIGYASVSDVAGVQIGSTRVYLLGGEMTINASFTGLPPGQQAVRLLSRGDCSADQPGAILEILPDVPVGETGAGTMSAILTHSGASLFDTDGTSIAVFGADGTRLACGTLSPG